MPYKDEVTWKDLTNRIESSSTQIINAIQEGENRYQKWLRLKGGNTNAQIATELVNRGATDVVTADVDALETTYIAMHQMYLFMTNVTAATGDHIASLRDFSA